MRDCFALMSLAVLKELIYSFIDTDSSEKRFGISVILNVIQIIKNNKCPYKMYYLISEDNHNLNFLKNFNFIDRVKTTTFCIQIIHQHSRMPLLIY